MTPRHEMTLRPVRYDVPDAQRVVVRKAIEYGAADAGVKTLDIYYPPDATSRALPAVVFVNGFSDVAAVPFIGCRINEMEGIISWARLVAASGLIAVTYTTAIDPAADTREAIRFVEQHGDQLGIDGRSLGLWASSSHVPNALGQLMERTGSFACAVLCYGFMLDLDGATGVADAQRMWRFANPAAGRTPGELPSGTRLLIVRAGKDSNPGLNDAIDRFVSHALAVNLPVWLVNHHDAPHAFELLEDTPTTHAVVRAILDFLCANCRRH
jgi:hypothetical protein